MKNIFQILSIFVTYYAIVFPIYSQDVKPKLAEDVIRKTEQSEFINQARYPARARERESQFQYGQMMAEEVIKNGYTTNDYFSVKRAFEPDQEKLGADIVTVVPGNQYSHINRIARPLAGYLVKAFEYNKKDADFLSMMLLYYNVALRNNKQLISDNYSPKVVNEINSELAGISISYKDWAGKTQLILPLKSNLVRPDEKDVGLDEIKKILEPLQPTEEKKLNEITEKRKEEDIQKLIKEKDNVSTEIKQTQQKRKNTEEQLKQTQKKLETLKKDPVKNQNEIKKEAAKQQQLEGAKKTLEKKESGLAKREEKIAKAITKQKEPSVVKKTASGETPIKKTEDKKKEELTKEIAKDIKKKEEEKSSNVVEEKILFLKVVSYIQGGHYKNEIWTIDAANDDTLLKGPFSSICGRKFIVIPGSGVLVIGYDGDLHAQTEDEGAHHLVLLDPEKLTEKKLSKERVFWRSHLEFRDEKIYAIEYHNQQYYLSRFNKDLSLDVRSNETIHPDSDVSFMKSKIYLTGKPQEGQPSTIHVLNRDNLKLIKTIRPGS